MHNPLLVIAIAVFVTVVHVGMLLAALSMPARAAGHDDPAQVAMRRRRGMAAGVAYAVAAAAAIGYGVMRRDRAHTHVTYWAALLILFFGLSYAVYSAVPKLAAPPATGADAVAARQKWLDASAVVHMVALALAVLSWLVAARTLQPLPALQRVV